jgi:hypothetical protein
MEPGENEKLHVIDFRHMDQRHPPLTHCEIAALPSEGAAHWMADDSIFTQCAGEQTDANPLPFCSICND